MGNARRLPPPRVGPVAPPRPRLDTREDKVAKAVAHALALRDESEEADEVLQAASARRHAAVEAYHDAHRQLEDAIEAERSAMTAAGDAAVAYLNARYEAQQLGGSMPGEVPRTARELEAQDLDEESCHG